MARGIIKRFALQPKGVQRWSHDKSDTDFWPLIQTVLFRWRRAEPGREGAASSPVSGEERGTHDAAAQLVLHGLSPEFSNYAMGPLLYSGAGVAIHVGSERAPDWKWSSRHHQEQRAAASKGELKKGALMVLCAAEPQARMHEDLTRVI